MGQKIHPYGYRVGITQPHSARWYAKTYQYPQYVFEDFLLRQSLFKLLPLENLPRQRSEDSLETKLVRVKIERLIRNTIKIKLYVTSSQTDLKSLGVDSLEKTKKELVKSKIEKRNSNVKIEVKKDSNTLDRNGLLVNILKKSVNKKITKLNILKLQNIIYKLETFKTMIELHQSSSSEKTINSSKTITATIETNETNISEKELRNVTIISSNYLKFKNLIYGIKLCLQKLDSSANSKNNNSLNSIQKLKLQFQLLQLKKQLCIYLVNQFEVYNQFEKQKPLSGKNSQSQNKEFQILTDSRFLKLSKSSFYWKNRVLKSIKFFNIIYSKLKLKLEVFESIVEKNTGNLLYKVSLLLEILKIQSFLVNLTLTKEHQNTFLSVTLSEILSKLKIKLLSTNNIIPSKTIEEETAFTCQKEISLLVVEKQKILKLINFLKLSQKSFLKQLDKTKNFIVQLCYIKSKLKKLNSQSFMSKLSDINYNISTSILLKNKMEKRSHKIQKFLQNLVFTKTLQIQTLISKLEKNYVEIKSLSLLDDIDNMARILKISQISHKLSDYNQKNVELNYMTYGINRYFSTIRNITKNSSKTNPNELLNSNFMTNTVQMLKHENLIAKKSVLTSILKNNELTKFSKIKVFYQFCKFLLTQRLKVKQLLELKIKSLLLSFTLKTPNSKNLVNSIPKFNNQLKINNLYIKQLEKWLTLLKLSIFQNSSSNIEFSKLQNVTDQTMVTPSLLQSRILKIDRYLNKLIPLKSNNLLGKIERTLIYVNFNLLKQKLIFELLQIQRSNLFSLNLNNFITPNKFLLSKTNLITLNKIVPILKNRIIQLQTFFTTITTESDIGIKQPLLSQTLQLKTNLQNVLKKNYQKSFVVLQTRRKIYNNFLHRFGGNSKLETDLNKNLDWTNSVNGFSALNLDSSNIIDSTQQKILSRKSLQTLQTPKQKFLAKKTIKKKMKQFLIEMALKNNYSHINSLKQIYEVKTLSKLCDNFTDIQTLPKVSMIEFVKVRQPKQYAVCLANFIVENLEKRFSFRSTMKKAAEQAMSTPNVKGIKIQVSGRLNGAEIARTEWLRDGRVPLQTLRANIDYSYKTAKTIYGVLGVKVWIFKTTISDFK
uniref:Small ribosomal subunit protein uS3c n=1 Tax=Aphanochaete elegans TaxID=764105 RepID=A0A6H1XDS5_9CHLO|nr:ribosomal protein S3 [Aphanochaete elegans]QJA13742.1 ribosomal protein S3 [Aphanochaete elegans]